MRTRSPLAALLRVVVALVVASPAIASAAPQPPAPAAPPAGGSTSVDEQAEFEKGRNAYRAQKFEEADARFFNMLDPEHGTLHDKLLVKQARMYWAATQIALHRDAEATGQFEIILTEDRDYEPDPLAFSTEVVNKFIDAKTELRAKLDAIAKERYRLAAERRANAEAAKQREAERIKRLEQLAGEVEVTHKHSRWIALLPFGIGQFQNGQRPAGWFFLVSESVMVATGLATLPIYFIDLAQSRANSASVDDYGIAQQYLDRANVARVVNLAAYGSLAATVVIGAIQAEVAYVPDVVKMEPRALPSVVAPEPTPRPVVPPVSFGAAPLPARDGRGVSGFTLGLSGSF